MATNFLAQRNVTSAFPIVLPDNTVQVSAAATLDYTMFGKNSSRVLATNSGGFDSVAMSVSGQYQSVAIANNAIFYSSNYGVTWTASSSTNIAWGWICMSASGQYQYAITATALYASINYGVTWALVSGFTFTSGSMIACSASGQYVTVSSNSSIGVYISSNYGSTFTSVTLSSTGPAYGLCISASGQYQTFVLYNIGIWYSSNFGQSWTQSNASALGYYGVACSASGQFQIVTNYTGNSIYSSNDYGKTWAIIAGVTITNAWSIVCSSSGQYVVVGTGGNNTYYSTNFGKSFTSYGSNAINWTRIAMSSNAQYVIICGNGYGIEGFVTYSPSIFTSGSIILGTGSGNNQPQISYTQVGVGSTTNYGIIGFNGANTICWTAGGSVGIGTTAPGYTLDIVKQNVLDTSANISIRGYSSLIGSGPGINFFGWFNCTTPQGRIEVTDSGSYGGTMTFSVKPNSALGPGGAMNEYMRITNGGYVGIGTNAPAYTLDVNGSARVNGNMYASGLPTGSGFAPLLSLVGGQLTTSYTASIAGGGGSWTSPVQNTGIYLICVGSANGYTIAYSLYLYWVSTNQGSGVVSIVSNITITCNGANSSASTYTIPADGNGRNHQLIRIA